jgi:hypothetical protein
LPSVRLARVGAKIAARCGVAEMRRWHGG